jgi:subtilisin family serine protease
MSSFLRSYPNSLSQKMPSSRLQSHLQLQHSLQPGQLTHRSSLFLRNQTFHTVASTTDLRSRRKDIAIKFPPSKTPADKDVVLKGKLSSQDTLYSDPVSPQRSYYLDQYRLLGLRQGQQLHIELQSSRFDAYLELVDARTNKILASNNNSTLQGTDSSLTFTVKPNSNYLIRVSSATPRATGSYELSLHNFPASVGKFNFSYGYGLVDAAAAVARAVGQKPFQAVRDLGSSNWGLDLVKAPEVWAKGYAGKNVTVAVLDTGVDIHHPDLKANIWKNKGEIPNNGLDDDRNGFIDDIHGWNFAGRDSNDVSDSYGHGTHVSGTIAATRNRFGVTGVAHAAKIMPVRVIDSEEDNSFQKFDANVAAGIRYAVQNGAKVISMSLGSYPGDPTMRQTEFALRYARRAGVVAVMASGNERDSLGAVQPIEPALFGLKRLGIGVGAIDFQRRVASFSTPAGRKPLSFLVAPGVEVRSTVPGGAYEDYWSGTSMATPHVAGVVALMLSANPDLTPTQIERILVMTARTGGITVP